MYKNVLQNIDNIAIWPCDLVRHFLSILYMPIVVGIYDRQESH
jgi:hypothetical protein